MRRDTYLYTFVHFLGGFFVLIGSSLLLFHHFAPLFQFVFAAGACFLQTLLQRLYLSLQAICLGGTGLNGTCIRLWWLLLLCKLLVLLNQAVIKREIILCNCCAGSSLIYIYRLFSSRCRCNSCSVAFSSCWKFINMS